MSILDLIERLREKPIGERKRWAFGFALGVTFLIGFIWFSIVMVRLSATQPTNEVGETSAAATNTPFETISRSLGDAWGSVDRALRAFGSVEYVPSTASSSSQSTSTGSF